MPEPDEFTCPACGGLLILDIPVIAHREHLVDPRTGQLDPGELVIDEEVPSGELRCSLGCPDPHFPDYDVSQFNCLQWIPELD